MSQVDIKQPKVPLVPVMVAGALAILGTVGIVLLVSVPHSASTGEGMITAAAVYRAGATETPSSPGLATRD